MLMRARSLVRRRRRRRWMGRCMGERGGSCTAAATVSSRARGRKFLVI